MLNPEIFRERLSEWRQAFELKTFKPLCSPIVVYQSLFSLVHELKGSIQLSQDAQIQGLVATVLSCEELLRKMAYDEFELNSDKDTSLYELARGLNALEDLDVFLHSVAPPKPVLEHATHPIFSKSGFTWDALSRGRARSCARHGYLFYLSGKSLLLTDLGNYEKALQDELKPLQAIAIIRSLEPQSDPLASQDQAELPLKIGQIAAFLPNTKIPGGWSSL